MAPKDILAVRKSEFRERFRTLLTKTPFPEISPSSSPEEALKRGFRMGLRQGYGAGLIDGVELGYDVGADSLVSMLAEMGQTDPSETH